MLRFLIDEEVRYVDVRFCDLPGIMQHFTVPVSSFGQDVFDNGLNFDGSSIRGFQAIHESDMSLFPDPTTAYLDPFRTAHLRSELTAADQLVELSLPLVHVVAAP